LTSTVEVDTLRPPRQEYLDRRARLTEYLSAQHLRAAVLFDAHRVMYYTGFAFYPTERPIAAIITREGQVTLFVPRLELEHAEQTSHVDEVQIYEEYPGKHHPMEQLADLLAAPPSAESVGADQDGYPWVYGYSGPTLSEVTGRSVVNIALKINHFMSVKSELELMLIRESMRWAHLGHALLQKYTGIGLSEVEVSQRAGQEATSAMMAALGSDHKANALGFFGDGVLATYRGQVGKQSSMPHITTSGARFASGDTLVTGATAPVWGYYSELERTMFIGEPSVEQASLFQHMLNLQDIAFANIRAGVTAASVDEHVRAYYQQEGLQAFWRHHTGHGLGSRNHEWPFLDVGCDVVLETGMVFSVEPGLSHPEYGGFRHSDTIVVTETGCRRLSYYPREIEALTIHTNH